VLTRYGWLALMAAGVMLLAGRAFGIIELYVMGAALALLALAALVYVRMARVRLRVSRTVTPSRVHAGDTARVELSAHNRGDRRTPVLRLRDPVGGTRGAQLNLAPLGHGETARAAYRLPTASRGVVRIGPLAVEVGDPLGLAGRTADAAPVLELTVFPVVAHIAAPRGGGDRNPTGATVNANALGRQGDEFFALRDYVVGDDLRRVHWPSTARHDELMVRQDEMPWQDRTTLVLDVRRSAHDADSFERAMSVTASVLSACARERHLTRLLASDATDSTTSSGVAHVESIMEYLARAEPTTQGSLRHCLDGLVRSVQGGFLVAVLGRATTSELDALARLRRVFRAVVVVATLGPLPTRTRLHGSLVLVDATRDGAFAPAWAATVAAERTEVAV
jgi:uncharacterized protein (DUF58 family)